MVPDNCRFVIAKKKKFLDPKSQKFFVDGIVRDYVLQPEDKVWDHHQEGGSDCQIQDMQLPSNSTSLLEQLQTKPSVEIVSPVYDPDCIIAAVYLILEREYLIQPIARQRMLAVSLMCDHLIIPPARYPELQKYNILAAKCIGSIYATRENWRQAFHLSKLEGEWNEADQVKLESASFERMVRWFAAAIRGDYPWPGEFTSLSRSHWKKVNRLKHQILCDKLITVEDGVVVFDARKLSSRDPRAAYAAMRKLRLVDNLRILTIWQNYSGSKFTFWTNPEHDAWPEFSYHEFISKFNYLTHSQGGARRTWGGSDWDVDILERISVPEVIRLLKKHS